MASRAFVTMGGPRPNSAEETLVLPGINAYSEPGSLFGQGRMAVPSQLRLDDTITLLCTFGTALRMSNDDFAITLDDCKIEDAGSPKIGSQPSPRTTASTDLDENPVQEFSSYTNSRFGFAIEYPSSFVAKQPPPTNGDGITLTSQDGEASLVIAGSNNDGFTLLQGYHTALDSIGSESELGYHKIGGSWFVISWRSQETLGYQKTFVGKGSQNSFRFTFPESQRGQYEQITIKLEKTFKPGQLDQSW
jgi:hypothetical protein